GGKGQSAANGLGVAADHVSMAGSVELARFGGAGESFNRLLEDLDVAVFLAAAQLAQGGDEFFEILRAGLIALEKALDVGRDLLALRGEAFALGKFFDDGYAIAAVVLGGVHSGVGDTNDVLGRETVAGEAGHAEAAGDVVFGEHGVL